MQTSSRSLAARQRTRTPARSAQATAIAEAAEAVEPRPLTAATSGAFQGALIALIRIAMGPFWYQELFMHLPGRMASFSQLMQMVARGTFVPGYAGIMQKLLIPHASIFALFVWALESFIALSLLFGFLTRLGGTLGAIWAALLFCGLAYASGPGGHGGGGPGAWYFGFMVLLGALLALTAAGRSLGVDRWLRPIMLRRAAAGDRVARYVALAE